jgi:hypothetical protein
MIGNAIAGITGIGVPIVPTSYESIATVTVGSGGTSTIAFSSIAADWTHLQIRCLARTNRAATGDQLRFQLNTDTAANYSQHVLSGDGALDTTSSVINNTYMWLGRATGDSAAASIFGATIIDIFDYKNTNKYKTLRSLSASDRNGSGEITLNSGSWRNTNAISSVQITFIGTTMQQYSTFALYGVK